MAPLVASSAGLVLWGNVVVPRLPAGPVVRAAANAAGAAALVGAARRNGYGWRELGLSPGLWTAGARLGGPAAGAAGGAFAVLLATAGGRAMLANDAQGVAGTGVAEKDDGERAAASRPVVSRSVLLRSMLTIPVGTALAEEVAFRGVLQAMAERRLPPRAALAWCAATFSVWHLAGAVEPARLAARPSPLASAQLSPGRGGPADVRGGVAVRVLGDLVATAAAGAVFGLMRRRSGSILAPLLLHLATNSGGLLAAAAAGRIAARPGSRCGWDRYAGGAATRV